MTSNEIRSAKDMMRTERPALLQALERSLDDTTPTYKAALARVRDLSPKSADLFHHFIADEVRETLRREPEFEKHPRMMIRSSFSGQSGFSADMVAPRLLKVASDRTPKRAVDWLNKILSLDEARASHVTLLWGIEPKARLELAAGIELAPVSEIPESAAKEFALGQEMARFFDPTLGVAKPKAALLVHRVLRPLLVEQVAHDFNELQALQELVQDVTLSLTLVGPSAPVTSLSWTHIEDEDVRLAGLGTSYELHAPEITPTRHAAIEISDDRFARSVVEGFLALQPKPRKKVRRALDRLNRAIRRRDVGDRALELGTALDLLLVGDHGEHTWKVSYRASLLARESALDRVAARGIVEAIYGLRSALVHEGETSAEVKVKAMGRLPTQQVVDRGIQICADTILAIVRRGDLPEWSRFEITQI